MDWWSLGVVLVELLTGMNIFDASDFESIISNILHLKIDLPNFVSDQAKDVCLQVKKKNSSFILIHFLFLICKKKKKKKKLLQRNPKRRLCVTEGASELEHFEFYKSINWKELVVKESKPHFVPSKKEGNYDPLSSISPLSPPKRRAPVGNTPHFDFNALTVKSLPEYLQ